MNKTGYIAGIFLLISFELSAQRDSACFIIENGFIGSYGDHVPFWIISNCNGFITDNPLQAYSNLKLINTTNKDKDFSFGYGVSLYGSLASSSQLYFDEWYTDLKLKFLSLELGSKRKFYELQNTQVGSGNIIWSGNARPLPAISLSTNDFIPVPFTKEFLEINSGLEHGWMPDFPGIKDVFLHHKWLMTRIGGKLPVHFSIGLHHFAQWGGYSDTYGELEAGLSGFWRVFLARSGGEVSPIPEQINVAGNHLGSYQFKLDYKNDLKEIGIYWETYFEDNSGRRFWNFPDGLYGIYLKNSEQHSFINQICIEYLATDNQSGVNVVDTTNNIPPTGQDDYFNHYIYRMGWTNHTMTIGTPFISSPVFSIDENEGRIINNRVRAVHFGIAGFVKSVEYRFLLSHTLNMGRYVSGFDPYRKNNMLLFSVSKEDVFLSHSSLNLDIGIDLGEFYGNNLGILLRWQKRFFIL